MRLQNDYTLYVDYEYTKDSKTFFLEYRVFRIKGKGYVLTIGEGGHKADIFHDFCTLRDERFEFQSVEEVLNYLKQKESFRILD